MSGASCLYVGHVVHKRLRPRRHSLRYKCFWTFLDIDELPALHRRLRLFGYNRFAPVSFHAHDHGDGKSSNLRSYVEAELADAGIDLQGGTVRLLCMPRITGYAFNPVSIYFCHFADGALAALIWEVNNTFGERHSYVIEATDQGAAAITQRCDKNFFVSPFMDGDLTYEFRVTGPAETVGVVIRASDHEGPLLLASLSAKSRALTDANLLGLLVRQPFVTLKVISAIHWEALKLWLKGVRLRHKPPPPKCPVTIVRSASTSLGDDGSPSHMSTTRAKYQPT